MKYKMTSFAFLLLGLGGLYAQESTVSAGAEATGIGGTASYSIGQVAYMSQSGMGGNISQGVQQAFNVSTVGVDLPNIQFNLSVYPNPTSELFTLTVTDIDPATLEYKLYDLQGKSIDSQKLKSNSTTVSMQGLASSAYILKITQNNLPIKTYRIIKN